jgi:hypothetical protein
MVVGWLNPVGGLGTSFIAFGAASLLAVAVIQVLERGAASGPRRLNVERA